MDYKQKYEDAFKKAKDLHDNHALGMPFIYETCEQIFPELKESEDEKIRKEIINFLELPHPQFVGKRDHEKWIAWLEKQGEQKTDKVAPKFKIGDWVVQGKKFYQIEKVTSLPDNHFQYWTTDGVWFGDGTEAHLWTIQDAKDGDILVWDDSNCIAIFSKIENDESFISYGFIGNITGVFEKGYGGHSITNHLHPATKEQCNLLFQKMKEAGYKWDVEKKELRKIEQKPDFCHHEVDFSNCSEEYRKAYYDGWNNCNQQHAQLKAEQNPAWSKEDERLQQCLIRDQEKCLEEVKNDKVGHSEIISDLKEMYRERINWLKSLEERMKGE